jgi:hypothetical protein
MRTLPLLLLFLINAASVFCQQVPVAPVPPDPLELVTGPTQVPANAQQRGALVSLMNRAVSHYALHQRGGPPHVLQISFNATASTLNPGGAGQLRETWISGENWRWDGNLGGYTLLRISSNAAVYDQNPDSMIPLRLKMLANAVFAPIEGAPRRATIRTTNVEWKGAQISCILMSAEANAQTPATGRQWYETEYCIDPATGLLNIYSKAPGIYAVYDYANALSFHGRVLPGSITIAENGSTVLAAQLTSIVDSDPSNTSPFTPTSQMIAQGPAAALQLPTRFPLPGPSPAPGAAIQPVIVHAVIDAKGNVRESEVLQTNSVSAAALDFVTGMRFPPEAPASGASPTEREAYINVRFEPVRFQPQPENSNTLLH